MKKIALVSKGKFRVTDADRPLIRNRDDVLLKVEYVGVCGSDIHYFTTGRIGDQVIDYPFVIGHECSARVVEIGPDVERVRAGDSVCVEPLHSCGQCEQCQLGRPHTCLDQKFMGCPGQMEGGLAEYLVLPEKMCVPFPDTMTHQQAVLVEPMAIALYAAGFIDAPDRKSIAILGFGPIGISVLLSLRQMGCRSLFVSDRVKERIQLAGKLGAVHAFDAADDGYEKKIRAECPSKFDVVIECCGRQEAIDTAQKILRPGGMLLLIGIPEEQEIRFDPHLLRRNEISIQNVRRQNHCVEKAIQMISRNVIDVDFMITHLFEPDKADMAFQMVSEYRDGVIKALIKMSG